MVNTHSGCRTDNPSCSLTFFKKECACKKLAKSLDPIFFILHFEPSKIKVADNSTNILFMAKMLASFWTYYLVFGDVESTFVQRDGQSTVLIPINYSFSLFFFPFRNVYLD